MEDKPISLDSSRIVAGHGIFYNVITYIMLPGYRKLKNEKYSGGRQKNADTIIMIMLTQFLKRLELEHDIYKDLRYLL